MSEVEPNQEAKSSRKSFDWFSVFFAIVVIASLAVFILPMVIRNPKINDRTLAYGNLRQIGRALLEFETKYGSLPSESTVALVNEKNPGHGHNLSGKSSNALFRQLLAANMIQSEMAFRAQTDSPHHAQVNGTRQPDEDISPGQALKKGEVAFGYIAGLSSEGNPARVVAFCPIIPGTDRFDPKPFKGKAVILRMDCSATSVNIDKHGHVVVGGINILSTENPIWGGEKPDIRYPDL